MGLPALCRARIKEPLLLLAVQTQCNATEWDEVSQPAPNTTGRLSSCEEHAACKPIKEQLQVLGLLIDIDIFSSSTKEAVTAFCNLQITLCF